MINSCPICKSNILIELYIKEMMFGTREIYLYKECQNCFTLFFADIKERKTNTLYKNDKYYSFNKNICQMGIFKKFIRKQRVNYLLWKKGRLGKILQKVKPIVIPNWLLNIKLSNYCDKILDVGCGSGNLLFILNNLGFDHLTGIDIYLENDLVSKGVSLIRKSIFELSGKYSVIMFHHSFEHMDNPKEVLDYAYKLIEDDGCIVIRIPVKDSYAWDLYKENWVQIDAPRHSFIFTRESFSHLIQQTGFKITHSYSDSYSLQFWGSEQYKKNISLFDNKSYSISPLDSLFTKKQIDEYEQHSHNLNIDNKGDQAVFILRKLIE